MSNEVIIAVDVMGGDNGLKATIPGCALALKKSGFKLLLVGDKRKINNALKRHKLPEKRIEIVHAPEEVLMDEEPLNAMRNKKQSSMRIALDLVKEGKADACISAGNTGALMATAKFVLKTLPGISRPALLSAMPGVKVKKDQITPVTCYMLDLGANIECDSEQLCQFAVMGSVLAQKSRKIRSPRVKLLNIGSEDFKGLEVIKEASVMLEQMPYINYKGFIEANEIYFNSADVIVCDGFVGNIALKASEGIAKYIKTVKKFSFNERWYYMPLVWLGGLFLYPVLHNLRHRLDTRKYNGASLLGLKGVVIKSHGNACKLAFETAVLEAVSEAKYDIPNQIGSVLAKRIKTD